RAMLFLCPLVPDRGSGKYQGPLHYGNRDLTPVDHYSGRAFDTLLGPAGRAMVATATQQNQRMLIGRPQQAVIGTHRIPGTRANSADPRARTFDPGNPALGYWDSAGHRVLVQRLGLRPTSCI